MNNSTEIVSLTHVFILKSYLCGSTCNRFFFPNFIYVHKFINEKQILDRNSSKKNKKVLDRKCYFISKEKMV